jgi:hypothetical protein
MPQAAIRFFLTRNTKIFYFIFSKTAKQASVWIASLSPLEGTEYRQMCENGIRLLQN